jgi:hypothetical protein
MVVDSLAGIPRPCWIWSLDLGTPARCRTIGFFVLAVTVGWVWGVGARPAARPGERFWTWLTVAQVVAGVQALVGRPADAPDRPTPLHPCTGSRRLSSASRT